jgi:hypothetical protein
MFCSNLTLDSQDEVTHSKDGIMSLPAASRAPIMTHALPTERHHDVAESGWFL